MPEAQLEQDLSVAFFEMAKLLRIWSWSEPCQLTYEPGDEKTCFMLYENNNLQRPRSACASAQSDQHLCCSLLDSLISVVSISKISRFHQASVAAQAG